MDSNSFKGTSAELAARSEFSLFGWATFPADNPKSYFDFIAVDDQKRKYGVSVKSASYHEKGRLSIQLDENKHKEGFQENGYDIVAGVFLDGEQRTKVWVIRKCDTSNTVRMSFSEQQALQEFWRPAWLTQKDFDLPLDFKKFQFLSNS